jgi:hypothetical protein
MKIKFSDISGYTKFVNTKFIDDFKEEEPPKTEIVFKTVDEEDDDPNESENKFFLGNGNDGSYGGGIKTF